MAFRDFASTSCIGLQFLRALWIAILVLPLTNAAISDTNATETRSDVDEATASADLLDSYRSRINVGESSDVIPLLEQMIHEIDDQAGQYDHSLVDPLVLLGDANFLEDEHPAALNAYKRAFEVSRLTDGLFSIDQLPIAYREANILARMGIWRDATQSTNMHMGSSSSSTQMKTTHVEFKV